MHVKFKQEDNIDKIDISCPDQILKKFALTKMNQDHAMSVLLCSLIESFEVRSKSKQLSNI